MAAITPDLDPAPSPPLSQPEARPATRRPRRYAREPEPGAPPPAHSRLDQLEALLLRDGGATLQDLVAATGWQTHSIRGAISGALRKRGLTIRSSVEQGQRTYTATRAAP
jgi:hypothetical protein